MYSRQRHSSGPPGWFVFIIVFALVFGAYYLWTGIQNFLISGGLGIQEATQMAATVATATAERVIELQTSAPTMRPTATPVPECQDFTVTVRSAILREAPTTNSAILGTLPEDAIVCVIAREGNSEWFLIDRNLDTRRLEPAYMHEDIIKAVNPTPTPTDTGTPYPTITLTFTYTPEPTIDTVSTATPDPQITPVATRTPVDTSNLDNVTD